MGKVVISPNIKKESVRIDPTGNIINAKTKQIIKPIEPEYMPPVQVVQPVDPVPIDTPQATPPVSKIDEMINRKIEEIVAKKIEQALSNL